MWDKILNLFIDSKTVSIIQKLSSLFMHFCQTRNKQISQTLAQFAIKVYLINPKNQSILNENVTSEEQQDFLLVCYDNLFDPKNITSLTLMMQCLFHGRFLKREEFKNYQKHNVIKKCHQLNQKLCNPPEDLKNFQKDLVRLILIKEGMADQNDPSAFHEMRTVVNAILPPSALSTFMSSNQKKKLAFINEISSIAAGIRLHSWYGEKAGKFMIDVSKLMKEILPQINEDLYEDLITTNNEIKQIEEMLMNDNTKERNYEKRCLIFLRNYNKFLKLIKESVQEVAVHTYKLDYTFTVQMRDLEEALKSGPLAKADKVYPSYKDIARTWQNVQMEGRILSFYSILYEELKSFASKFHGIESKLSIELSPTFPELKGRTDGETRIQKIMFEDVKNFNAITLEFQDFCAYYCSLGILVPCRRELGIIMFNGLCYGFSTLEAMESFESDPYYFLNSLKQNILSMPELILTLGMEKHFNLPLENVLSCQHVHPIFTSDISVQTTLHPIEGEVVKNYQWNQWSLRRKVLQSVVLMDKKTHSTQTNISHFRRENHSQVYLLRDQSTQTRRDI